LHVRQQAQCVCSHKNCGGVLLLLIAATSFTAATLTVYVTSYAVAMSFLRHAALPSSAKLRRDRARRGRPETKSPAHPNDMLGTLFWRRPTLTRPVAVLPSALQCFTSVFGMGTGGATALRSPEPRSACAARFWWRRFTPRHIGSGGSLNRHGD
jgi:hypothetical protein